MVKKTTKSKKAGRIPPLKVKIMNEKINKLRNEYYMRVMKHELKWRREVDENLTLKDLKAKASEYKISGRSKMNKDELIDAINEIINAEIEAKSLDEIINAWLGFGGNLKKLNREFYLSHPAVYDANFTSVHDALVMLELIGFKTAVFDTFEGYSEVIVKKGSWAVLMYYHGAEKKFTLPDDDTALRTYSDLLKSLLITLPKRVKSKQKQLDRYLDIVREIWLGAGEIAESDTPILTDNGEWVWMGESDWKLTNLLERLAKKVLM